MGDWSIGSVASRVQARIENIPTAISGANIQNFAEEAIYDINNLLNVSISTTAIGDQHKNIVVNLTCAYVLSYMLGVGINSNISLGEFSIQKGGQTSDDKQLAFFVAQANNSIGALRNRMRFSKVIGV